MDNAMTFLMALLGSSVGGAIVTGLFQLWFTNRQNEASWLKTQLDNLYGPLYFFTCQNQALFDLYNDYHKAYEKEYGGKNYTLENMARVTEEMEALLKSANSYVDKVNQNNQRVMGILEKGWHLIDHDDVGVFAKFEIDVIRLAKTKDERSTTSFVVYQHVGEISYMRPEMIKLVKDKWNQKRKRLKCIAGHKS